MGILIGDVSTECIATDSFLNLYSDQLITKGWCQPIVLFYNYFSLSGEHAEHLLAHKSEQSIAGCIAIYNKYCCYTKTWGHYIKWIYEILGGMLLICQMPRCGCMEHGLEYIMFYVEKHITPLAVCSGPPVGSRQPQGAPAFVRLAYCRPCLIRHWESFSHQARTV